MAIYHCKVKTISRGQGRTAVGAAAYRSGQKLTNELDGVTHDYSRKGGIADSFIMAPENAPEWATDRERLWNEVEAAETRKNSRTAREVEVALPVELNREQQKELLREFAQKEFVDRGMVADISIHDKKDGNPHAHILLTTREIDDTGFAKKNRDWDKKELTEAVRMGWEKAANRQLELAGCEARIDHRSNRDRGLEEKPSIHLGVAAVAMERKGKGRTAKLLYNKEIREFNKQLREAKLERQRLWEERKKQPTERTMTVRELAAAANKKLKQLEKMHQTTEAAIKFIHREQAEFLEKYHKEAIMKSMEPERREIKNSYEQLEKTEQELEKSSAKLQREKPSVFKFWRHDEFNERVKTLDKRYDTFHQRVDEHNRRREIFKTRLENMLKTPLTGKSLEIASEMAKTHDPEKVKEFDDRIKKLSPVSRKIEAEINRFEKLEKSLTPGRNVNREKARKAQERPVTVKMDREPPYGTKDTENTLQEVTGALKGMISDRPISSGGGPKLDQEPDVDWEWIKDNPVELERAISHMKELEEDRGLSL